MNTPQRIFTFRVIVQVAFIVVIVPMLPLLISWRWNWLEAWVYALVSISGYVISRALAAQRHPDLVAERARITRHADAASWDKGLAPLAGLGLVLIPLVAGIDARFDSSLTFNSSVKLVALLLLLAGHVLASYALIENRFFYLMVRIQTDHGHQVISSGPYRWVRHPGYAGAILAYLVTPVYLDAFWAFLPVAMFIIVLVIRTRLEDQTLQEELPGYRDYVQTTRYRLVPGIW